MPQKSGDDRAKPSREMLRVAQDVFYTHLKRVGLKRTAQRELILQAFLQSSGHLSTEELHHLVQSRDPSVGFTTVYRTLKLLAECGLAGAVAFQDGVARYEHQFNRRDHHHMLCVECGASVEFDSPAIEKVEHEIGRKHGWITTRHTFQIYGICQECQRKNGRQSG